MTTENENIKDEELNEAELSDVKNSIASLCKKYLTGSFFDKLVDTSGIKIAKDILLGDLKNMIGKGTSGPAAKKFAIAIQMAKNPVAVDTIMSNYMLKGDGMGSGIGYSESTEIQGFREYLNEAKKGGCCGGKKKPSEEEIEEAIKVVEAEGYKVTRLEESKEEKNYVTEEEIENAKKIVESRGFKVVEKKIEEATNRSEKKVDESSIGPGRFAIPSENLNVDDLKKLIDDAIDSVPNDDFDAIQDIRIDRFGRIIVSFDREAIDDKSLLESIWDSVEDYMKTATGAEADYGEEIVDNWDDAFYAAERNL